MVIQQLICYGPLPRGVSGVRDAMPREECQRYLLMNARLIARVSTHSRLLVHSSGRRVCEPSLGLLPSTFRLTLVFHF